MSFLDRMNGKVFAGRKGPHGNRKLSSRKLVSRKPDRRLTMEHMESRVMMSATPISKAANYNLDHLLAPALSTGTNQLGTGLTTVSSAAKTLEGALPIKIITPHKLPPAAPTLTATPYSASQINLTWNNVSNVSSYLVDEWIPPQTIDVDPAFGIIVTIPGFWAQLASVGSGTTSYHVTGLNANTTYQFEVIAENGVGTTASKQVSATTGVAVDHPTASAAYSNVSGTLFGKNGPSFLDVEQGAVGDCWLLASLAEVAARDPQDIKNMFTADGTTVENGTKVNLYKVRFFNSAGVAEYVTVDTELPGGGTVYDQPLNNVLWVALAEKAYVEANAAGYVTTFDTGDNNYGALDNSTHPNSPNQGGIATWALQAITGASASQFAINPTNIVSAWNAGQLIVIGTGSGSSGPVSPGILAFHAYAVVDCTTPASNQATQFGADQVLLPKDLPSYTPSSEMPFLLFNPHGATSSGYARDGSLGLFTANENFVAANFTNQNIGSGAATELGGLQTRTHLTAETAADLVLAGWGT